MPEPCGYVEERVLVSLTSKVGSVYTSWIRVMYFCGSPNLVRAEMSPACESLSKAMDQSRKSKCNGEFVASKSSCTLRGMCIGSLVDLALRNPYWVVERYWSRCLATRCWVMRARSLYCTLSSAMGR